MKERGFALQNIILLGLGLFLIYHFAPGLWEKGAKFYQENFDWTEEARRSNPVKYLKYAREKLGDDLSKLQGNIKDLEVQSMRTERQATKLAEDQGKYEELLNRAKNLYEPAEAHPQNGYPIKFAGASYSKDEFLAQMQILFNKNKVSKQQFDETRKANDRIRKALTEMHTKYAQARGALENIDTTIVIAEANAASSEVKTYVDQIATAQQDIDVYLGDYEASVPIRSADDLMKKEFEGGAGVMDADFKKFLGK
jgi:phage shock protein A